MNSDTGDRSGTPSQEAQFSEDLLAQELDLRRKIRRLNRVYQDSEVFNQRGRWSLIVEPFLLVITISLFVNSGLTWLVALIGMTSIVLLPFVLIYLFPRSRLWLFNVLGHHPNLEDAYNELENARRELSLLRQSKEYTRQSEEYERTQYPYLAQQEIGDLQTRADNFSRTFYSVQILTIIASALASAIGPTGVVGRLLAGVPAVLTSISSLTGLNDRFPIYRQAADSMENELRAYWTKTYRYENQTDKIRLEMLTAELERLRRDLRNRDAHMAKEAAERKDDAEIVSPANS